MQDNILQISNPCQKTEYTLWLKHTEDYNYINAYNLAYLSKLAYSDVVLPETEGGAKPNGLPIDRDFADFIGKARRSATDRTWETAGRMTGILPIEGNLASNLSPFIKVVCLAKTEDNRKGIKYYADEGTGYVDMDIAGSILPTMELDPKRLGNHKLGVEIKLPRSVAALFYTDKDNMVLSVRGTMEALDDLIGTDLEASQVKSEAKHSIKGLMHEGFYEQAKYIIQNSDFQTFKDLTKGTKKNLFITGHSMGGAVATILAAYLSEQGLNPLLYTFGSPRVGDVRFVAAYSHIKHFRHFNDGDIVPLVPGRFVDGGKESVSTGIGTGALIGGKYGKLHGAVVGGVLGGIAGILDFDAKRFTHHGDLCQIIGTGFSNKAIVPFSSHNIRQKDFIEYHENSEQIKALYEAIRDKEAQNSPYLRMASGKSAYPSFEEVAKTNNDIATLKTSIDNLEQRNQTIAENEDRADKKSSLLSPVFGIAQHDMDTYLGNLETIIKSLWIFFSVSNTCRPTPPIDCPQEAYTQILSRLKTEIAENLAEVEQLKKDDSIKNYSRSEYTTTYVRNHQAYNELINSYEDDIKDIETLEKTKIQHHFIYNLRAGDSNIHAQLNLLVGKSPNSFA